MKYEKLDGKGRERYLSKAVLSPRGYILHRLLGRGAFSDVYCVEDSRDGRWYACKVSGHAGMLEREARVIEGLEHALFPTYAGFWTEGGLGILIREHVEGSALEEMLKRRCFSAEQTVRTGLSLAGGIGYLHGLPERLLFRDVKPANVIIRQDGGVKLIDFGCICSMAGEVTSRAGSPGFAAPEQLRDGGVLTEACDVYGLGKTLEAMLGREGARRSGGRRLGRMGPEGAGVRGRLREVGRALAAGRLERRLRRVLEACTQEEAEARIRDMGAVARELASLLTGMVEGF